MSVILGFMQTYNLANFEIGIAGSKFYLHIVFLLLSLIHSFEKKYFLLSKSCFRDSKIAPNTAGRDLPSPSPFPNLNSLLLIYSGSREIFE